MEKFNSLFEGVPSYARPKQENMSNMKPWERITASAINKAEENIKRESAGSTDKEKLKAIADEEMKLNQAKWLNQIQNTNNPEATEEEISKELAEKIKNRLTS